MRVLVACEFSGIVRDAFRARGHDACSCDFLETERMGPHLIGDVLDILDYGWDMMIAHPPCTYLANSGVQYFARPCKGEWGEARFKAMEKGAAFFNACLNAPIPKICVENPIPHKYARPLMGQYQQLIQPWYFGHREWKSTCLWLKGLPPLMWTAWMAGEIKQSGWYGPCPGGHKKFRLRTFTGIAEAMALQWG
jgi:hypothetical protein